MCRSLLFVCLVLGLIISYLFSLFISRFHGNLHAAALQQTKSFKVDVGILY